MPTRKDITDQIASDAEVIRALAKRADNHQSLHIIEHHFVSETPEPLKEIMQLGKLLDFESSDFGASDDEDEEPSYSVNLISNRTIDLHMIARESILMFALGEACGCDYDGWGTHIEK